MVLLSLLTALLAEKQHQQFTSGIAEFSKDKLHKATTQEKNPLPDNDGSFLLVKNVLIPTLPKIASKAD